MFYVYNDRTAKITDPYTIPGNIQLLPEKKQNVDAILERTKQQMYSNLRTPVHDVKSSHFYKDVSSVRNPKELYRALKQLQTNPTQAEASVLFRAFPDNLGGFDFRKFGDKVVCSEADRRKSRRLDRVLVPDGRRTNVYAVRSLPAPTSQSQVHSVEDHNAPLLRDMLASTVPPNHPFSPNSKHLLAAGEMDVKTQFPHSLPSARVDTHEALQRYTCLASPDHTLTTLADPVGSRGTNGHCHVATNSTTIRPRTSVFVTETEKLLGTPSVDPIRPATTGNLRFTGSRSYTGVGLSATGTDLPAAVSRGLWSHSPVPEADGHRVRKHHPSSHKIAQLHHLAYRPMIRAAPVNL